MKHTLHPARAIPKEPTLSQFLWDMLTDTLPASQTPALCRACDGSGRVTTIGYRGPGPEIACWDCDGTGVQPR